MQGERLSGIPEGKPLAVHGAYRDPPLLRAVEGQLRDVVRGLATFVRLALEALERKASKLQQLGVAFGIYYSKVIPNLLVVTVPLK